MSEDKEMSFLDHLEELRWHVVRSLSAIFIFMIAAFVAAPWIFEHIVFAPAYVDFPTFRYLCEFGEWIGSPEQLCVKEIPFKIQSRFMTGQFSMHLTASFVIGLVVAFPYVFWEIWRFIKPGLHVKEKRSSTGAVTAVSFLFMVGVLFGYFVMSPLAVWFLANYTLSDIIVNEFDITSYVSTIVMLILGSGLLFQLPVVVYFLTKIGLLTPAFMRKNRKYAIIIILVVGAIITPPDPVSQSLIALPLYLLYEISIFISAYEMRQQRKQDEADALTNDSI